MRSISALGLLLALAAGPAMAEQASWMTIRDDFLGDLKPVLLRHCAKGRADNKAGLSLFNDAWVKQMTRLRFQAGVDDQQGTTSKAFFAGLSAAVSQACPGIW
ncbi:MAG: hypothetical protein ACKOFN_03765 [Vulcanococcus sp.]